MNNNILDYVRNKTKEDLKEKLSKYNRCVVQRCTGFGKTWLLSEISQEYDSVLYLYPTEIIKQTAISAINSIYDDETLYETELIKEVEAEMGHEFDYNNIKFMTYQKFARLTKSDIEELPDYSLIIMDEVHRIGGKMTKQNMISLLYYKKNSHIIGATATPERMDAFDVISEFFKGICVYPYNLHDAIQDGIIKMPYYVYCTYDIETSYKQAARLAGQDIENPTVKEVLNSRLFEVSKIHNLPNVIHSTIEQYAADKMYMKFIAFFATIKQLNSHIGDVKCWFEKAYPQYRINILVVSTENKKTRENINNLNRKHRKNTIDIIACVDMLNLGYHVSDLTGIIMYRCTQSSTIYIQQLGRALSTGSKNACIVFDVVDNLHRKSIFNLVPQNSRRHHTAVTKKERVQRLLSEAGSEWEDDERELLQRFIEDDLEAEDEIAFNDFWAKVNEIKEEDIYAVDHLATYRELIAKTVAEVKTERIKRATEEYFRIQLTKCNKPIPKTIAEVKKLKNTPPELEIFARWQQVEEEDILQYLDPDNTGQVDIEKLTYSHGLINCKKG